MKKRRFHERVWLERKVLGIVNHPEVFRTALSGLTDQAIKRWKMENEDKTAEQVEGLLKEISTKSNLRVDCSKDSFDQDELTMTAALATLMDVLEVRVRDVAAQQRIAGLATTPNSQGPGEAARRSGVGAVSQHRS